MSLRSASTRAALITAALVLAAPATPADAALNARANSATQSVRSASWGAIATKSTTGPFTASSPLTLTFTGNKQTTTIPNPQYLTIGNTGALPLNAATYTLTTDGVAATLEACSTGWNENTNACSGTITTVVTTATSPANSSAGGTINPGTGIRLRLRLTTIPNSNTKITTSIAVTNKQARAATTTNN